MLEAYPRHALAARAQFQIGYAYYQDLKDYPAAAKAFRETVRKYPGTEQANSAAFMLESTSADVRAPASWARAPSISSSRRCC